MLSIRLLAAICAATAAFALAACDGDREEKNDYVGELNEITPALTSELEQISTGLTAVAAPDKVSRALSSFAAEMRSIAGEIAAITPPGEVADLQAELLEHVRTLGDEATDAADEIRAGGAASVIGAGQQFVSEAARVAGEIDATITEINSELQG